MGWLLILSPKVFGSPGCVDTIALMDSTNQLAPPMLVPKLHDLAVETDTLPYLEIKVWIKFYNCHSVMTSLPLPC